MIRPPAKASRGGTYFVPSSLRLRESRPEKAVLSARPGCFCAASGLSGLKRVDPWLQSSAPRHSLTPAISQCARINLR